MKDAIHIILTGGRIDSIWDGNVDEIVLGKESVIPGFFKGIGLRLPIVFTQVSMKDSRALTLDDREKIREAIDSSETNKIIITHGTHTLPDTMQYLETHLKNKDKTIVFTGSSTPLKDFALSDAGFNLGYAIAKVQELPSGMYLCIGGVSITDKQMEEQLQEGKFYKHEEK